MRSLNRMKIENGTVGSLCYWLSSRSHICETLADYRLHFWSMHFKKGSNMLSMGIKGMSQDYIKLKLYQNRDMINT